ncbi:hypothetical protein R3P38DRAFT_2844346 [Favolaschia claudopus]|uniref:Uncharacterized protein n=1 Tax=Favolaschia claudopus TaxID=2862362 RepID=A0AAW0E666_9AGAR
MPSAAAHSLLALLFWTVVTFSATPTSCLPIASDVLPQHSWRLDVDITQCFAKRAAIAADCESLLADPPIPDWTARFSASSQRVFKPLCHRSCCVFTDSEDIAVEDLVDAGNTLMGCLQPANGLINGVTSTEDGIRICIADAGSGAETCKFYT